MGCTHNCNSCGSKCSAKEEKSFIKKPHDMSNIKKIIGIVSGKGGVGKSLVTSLLATSMNRLGYNIGILDADITGPSIPKAFGLSGQRALASSAGMFPVKTKGGIDVMSINLLLDNEKTPVVWRGPVIASTVNQFWTDVIWQDIDFMFVDMPPGTGDVPLTVFQSMPIDGIIVMTSPQDLVSMIVSKAVNMANKMNINVLGLIENYSYFICPDCDAKHSIFGDSHIEDVAKEFNLEILAKLPMDKKFAKLCDEGNIELFNGDYLNDTCKKLEMLLK